MFELTRMRWIIVIGIALAVGVLYVAPSVLIRSAIQRSGGVYLLPQLAIPTQGDSAIWYVPFDHEVAEGHFPPVDLFVPANRAKPFLVPPLPFLLFGGLIALTGNANSAYLVALALFPPIIFFAFFWLGRKFFRDWLGTILFAMVGTMTPVVIYYLERSVQLSPIATLKNFLPFTRTPIPLLYLSRINEPLLVLPFFILAFGLLYQFWREPTKQRGVYAGSAIAMLAYLYLHYFIFMVGFAGLLFLYELFINRRNIKVWFFLIAIAALIIIPFGVNSLRILQLPDRHEILLSWAGAATEYGRGFRTSVWRDYLLYAFFAAAIWMFRKRLGRNVIFFGAILVLMVLLWNMQLITGFNLQVDHWYKVFGLPLYLLSAILIGYLVEYTQGIWPFMYAHRAVWRAIVILLIASILTKRVVNAANYIHPDTRTLKSFSFSREVYQSWEWMNAHVPRDATVISDSYVTSIYLIDYTSVDPYLAFAEETLLPWHDLEERFLTAEKLFGVPYDRVEFLLYGKYRYPTLCDVQGGCADEHTSRNFLQVPAMLYGAAFSPQTQFDQLERPSSRIIPPDRMKNLLARYRELNADWTKFSGAWVYYGPWEREIHPIDFSLDPHLEQMYNTGGIAIYRVR